jgi:NAD-dependent SIR2 family protein deacetylase
MDALDAPTAVSVPAAARAIARARALLVTAGAGMGVDSGLPDFRGNEGFWKAYPPYRRLGLSFVEMANPRGFQIDPPFAWGFYGHRLNLYRGTVPHAGFATLRRWGEAMAHGSFVFTSNVDGQFQRAGFDEARILECHGSIHHVQCTEPCLDVVRTADAVAVDIDAQFRAREPLPRCPACGGLARPNVLMFGDGAWVAGRTEAQERRFGTWLDGVPLEELVVVELGAGTAVPTVRLLGERLQRQGATLVRINVREPEGPPGTIGLAGGAAATLAAIDQALAVQLLQ